MNSENISPCVETPLTAAQLLCAWDQGLAIETAQPIPEMVAVFEVAVEFTRAMVLLPFIADESMRWRVVVRVCERIVREIALGCGLTRFQLEQARALAWQWCFGLGPQAWTEKAVRNGFPRILVKKRSQVLPQRASVAFQQ